jgi:hypothetical protein
MTRRHVQLFCILAALLAGSALWTYQVMAGARDMAVQNQSELADCYKMAAQIDGYNHSKQPALAADGELKSSETTALIEQSAKSAGIPQANLAQIFPESPQRLGDSAYKEKPTQVRLENVSLQQLTAMLYALAGNQKPLQAKSIRLAAPRQQETGNLWTAELSLTYLIYDPIKTKE